MSLHHAMLLLAGLLGLAVVLGLIARRVRVPVTVVLAMVGFLGNVTFGGEWVPREALRGEMFEQVLILVFLPVLVFAAALGLSVRAFFRNLGAIVALAVVAMLISTVLVGGAVHVTLGMPLLVALVFGALISATDPVAVVAVFREVGVPRRLLTLVEGESLFNDGAAIVLSSVLLAAAIGDGGSAAGGVVRFATVVGGGLGVGVVLGLMVAAVMPWLDRLAGIGLSLALAYGSFVLAEEVFGFSGVMATVAAGLIVHGLAPSRASEAVRDAVEQFWESLDFVGNALLFLAIGLVIEPALLRANLTPIALAVIVVIVARALAVMPVVAALERWGVVPRVGLRNQAVLVWGGLRGGVALALALALPEQLPARDTIVAMTAGVVLATLLLNATTISPLVRKLGLAEPSRHERFLAASARLAAAIAARQRLADLDVVDAEVGQHLDEVEQSARKDLAQIDLQPEDKLLVVTSRGLAIERQTYQHLSDGGLLPPAVTRKLLHEVDDQIEAIQLGQRELVDRPRPQPSFDRMLQRVIARLPTPPTESPEELAYAEATGRRLAARRASEELTLFEQLPNVEPRVLEQAREAFQEWEQQAVARLEELVGENPADHRLRRQQAQAASTAAAADALQHLADVGLLPRNIVEQADGAVAEPS